MTNEEKQNIVKQFLLTPIFYNKKHSKDRIDKGFILTKSTYSYECDGHIYLSNFDCDMSNVAIKFYSIIYEMKENEILDKNGIPKTKEIVGDTMCSFKTAASDYLKKQTQSDIKKLYPYWPSFIQKFRIKYHCLANMWLLPEIFGRKSRKVVKGKSSYDYMDRFLSEIIDDYNNIFSEYPQYKDKFNNFDEFVNKHFINGDNNYVSGRKIKHFSDDNLDKKIVIESMMKLIETRADAISKSKYCDQLYAFCTELIENGKRP